MDEQEGDTTHTTGSVLDKVTARLTVIGAIVTAVVALNTSVSGCVDTDQQRYGVFRTAVDKEESFWKGLFGDLNDALKKDVEGDERRTRLLLIRSMSDRPLPTFAEYHLRLIGSDAGEKTEAVRYIGSLRDRLRAAVLDRSIVGDAIGDQIQSVQFNNDQADRQRDREGVKVTPKAQEQTVAAVDQAKVSAVVDGVSYDTQSLSVGIATGWDVDVFWCVGENEGARYGLAQAAATALATKAEAQEPLASGVALGRVRLRALPLDQQRSGLYPVKGNTVVFDRAKGERAAANALFRTVATGTGLRLSPAISDNPSKWYLSVFVCSAPAGPALKTLPAPPPPSPA